MKLLIIDNLAVNSSRREIYRELAKKVGDKIHLLVPESWKEQGIITKCEDEKSEFIKLYTSPFLFGYRHQRIIYTKLKSLLQEIKPNIVFISSEPENFNTFHLVCLIKRLFPEIKVACATWRNIDYRFNPYPYKLSILNKFIEKYTTKRIDLCIAHSYSAIKIMRDIADWEVVFIPPAIDLKKFVFDPKKDGNFTVGYIGRLAYEKGVDVLIKAISNLEIDCLIVGRGPAEHYLKELADKLKLQNKITWIDAVEYDKVPQILKKLNALVLPSRTTNKWKEQFGRILVEAMACGVYVIGSDSGDIPIVIGDYGFIFPEGNVSKLVEILNQLKNKEVEETLLHKARKMVEEKYNIENVVNIFYQTFTNLLIKK